MARARNDLAQANGIGAINWRAGTADNNIALIEGQDGGGSAEDRGQIAIATRGSGDSSPQTRMFIDSSGNVGIGTSAPAHLLTVLGSANTNIINMTAASGQTNVTMMRADGTAVTCGVDNSNVFSCS